jgi:hypothetical protein
MATIITFSVDEAFKSEFEQFVETKSLNKSNFIRKSIQRSMKEEQPVANIANKRKSKEN